MIRVTGSHVNGSKMARCAASSDQEGFMELTTLERLPLWIGGKAVHARTQRYGEVTNPATGEVIRHVPFANREDLDTAVSAARAALPEWKAAPALRRARILMRFR